MSIYPAKSVKMITESFLNRSNKDEWLFWTLFKLDKLVKLRVSWELNIEEEEQTEHGGWAQRAHIRKHSHSHVTYDILGDGRFQKLLQHFKAVEQRVRLIEVISTTVPAEESK